MVELGPGSRSNQQQDERSFAQVHPAPRSVDEGGGRLHLSHRGSVGETRIPPERIRPHVHPGAGDDGSIARKSVHFAIGGLLRTPARSSGSSPMAIASSQPFANSKNVWVGPLARNAKRYYTQDYDRVKVSLYPPVTGVFPPDDTLPPTDPVVVPADTCPLLPNEPPAQTDPYPPWSYSHTLKFLHSEAQTIEMKASTVSSFFWLQQASPGEGQGTRPTAVMQN
ncbi:hypothetical protein BDZ88DRAFT_507521 [Geranomyces variabilis]|nr:hypothetical protein BDZ88DRAFT_507521 [Geranomyces variabilis]